MNQLRVSVIIPAYNASKTIAKTIEACLCQSCLPFEVIVVDDGSCDDTAQIVQKFKSVNYVFQDNAGPAAARNRGAKAAQGEILLFTDSDCVPHSDWIEKIVVGFQQVNVAAVMGSYGIANPRSLLSTVIQAEIMFRHYQIMPNYPKAFGSYNVGIRKEVFNAVGGFDFFYPRASGEDNDLSYKIVEKGNVIFFARDAVVDHHHTENLGKYLKEQFQHGFWRVKMYADHPDKVRGDDYTFWKDIMEIGLVFLLVLVGWIKPIGIWVLSCLVGIELIFALRMVRRIKERLLLFVMMGLRSFCRAAGFSSGIIYFFILKLLKNNK